MAVVTLTFTSSDLEITSGIPETITITSNVPSTIHFTLDGTTPTISSEIYITTLSMPDGLTSVSLNAFGIDSDGYVGPILTQVFSADQSEIDITRNIGLEGIRVDDFLDQTNIVTFYDADGDAVSYTDIADIHLREIHSSQGRLGIAAGTQVEVGVPDPSTTQFPHDDNFQPSSKVSSDLFNPRAKTIINDKRESSLLKVINRPYGSLRSLDRNTMWGAQELRGTDSTYISGGFVRRFYSPKSNTMVSYYFDHNESRHVKGIQTLPTNIPATLGFGNSVSLPLVFQWLPYGRHSTIPT